MKILAFPGIGKTPLALQSGKYIDLDFGHFREAMNITKSQEEQLLRPFAKLLEMYERDGFIVLSNDPKLLRFTKFNRVILPLKLKFSSRKLKVSEETINEWVSDWVKEANKFKVPVTFINVGLDTYLGGSNGKSRS